MSAEMARIVVLGIAGVCLVVWLVGLVVVSRTFSGDPQDELIDTGEPFETGSKNPHSWVSGTAVVDGDPEDVIAKATNILATNGTWFGPVKIVEQTERTLRFLGIVDAMGGSMAPVRTRGPFVRRGMLRASPGGNDMTRVDYDLEAAGLRVYLTLAVVFQVLGLVVIVGLAGVLYYFTVEAFHPAIQAQSVQMVQACHLLWPPFLLVWLYRRFRKGVRDRCETFLHNLNFVPGNS